LTELSLDAKGNIDFAVVGIGMNCCQKAGDFPQDIKHIATSLLLECGKPIDRSKVIAAMLMSLYQMSAGLLDSKERIMEQYRLDCITVGQDISLVTGDDIRHGTAVGIDSDGALLVRFPDGHTNAVNSGEVSVRGMYGYI